MEGTVDATVARPGLVLRAEKAGCHGTVFLMESVLTRLTRADITHSGRAYVNLARPEPSSSADHRTCRRPGMNTKDHPDAVGDTLAAARESVWAFPVLTTRVDHQRESSPVGSVHTPLPLLPP